MAREQGRAREGQHASPFEGVRGSGAPPSSRGAREACHDRSSERSERANFLSPDSFVISVLWNSGAIKSPRRRAGARGLKGAAPLWNFYSSSSGFIARRSRFLIWSEGRALPVITFTGGRFSSRRSAFISSESASSRIA